MSSSPRGAVLLDGLGTLIRLAPPGPALAAMLRDRHGLTVSDEAAAAAFAAEVRYYRAHHHEARDRRTLAVLRRECAKALRAALPGPVSRAVTSRQLTGLMLAALRFSAYPDALTALPLLRAQRRALVVVSNWDFGLPTVLRRVGLWRHLDGAVTSGEVGRPKPDPRIFRVALERVGALPCEALHVGDSVEHDVRGAQAAGIASVLLTRDRHAPACTPARSGALATIRSLDELPAIVSAAAGRSFAGAAGWRGATATPRRIADDPGPATPRPR